MLDEAFDLANIAESPVQNTLPSYVAALNPEQRDAVISTQGPVLVLAGAGTGKTRVLTTRIAHIIHQRLAWPSQILAVTFTNKAAAEMKERVAHLLAGATDASGLWLGTFHSIGVKILRRHAELLGFSPTFTILDADDQHRLIKQIMAEQNIDNAKHPGKVMMSIIQGWKDKALTPEKIGSHDGEYGAGALAAKLYPIYQARLKTLNAMDFGDLLLHCLTLFQQHPHILQDYAQRFHYVLVDEYQDTNVAQYLWLRMLALGHKNICCVGDDDQSIYGWRGAEVGNILKFEKDFPGATVIRLERNYRSTAPILAAASHLIGFNQDRLGKTLFTDVNTEGGPIRIKSVWDDAEEARFIGEEVEAYQRDGISLSDMAILVRAGFQTRSFEERFMTLGIAYKVVGGLRFYERMEIRDAIAYLRLIAQPHDDLALERIINTPKRGIGKATMEQLHTHARAHNCSLHSAIEAMLPTMKGKTAATIKKLMDDVARWRTLSENTPLSELADVVLEESGYRAMWQLDKSPEAAGRTENLRELIRALGEFESVTHFLEHVGLVSDNTAEATPNDAMISLMTLHAAKGLEFDTVFLTGWEEGLFPSQRTMDESGKAGLEEERRLAYVGITRAKKHCIITHAANRRIYNQWQSAIPSRFLQELPEASVEILEGGAYSRRASSPALFQRELDSLLSHSPLERESKSAARDWVGGQKGSYSHPTASANASATPSQGGSEKWNKGEQVFHSKFGNGIILHVEGNHLTIAFRHAGKKKVLADYIEKAK